MDSDQSSVYWRLKETAFSGGFVLPSKNELDALYNYWKTSGDTRLEYAAAPMWTSSHASSSFVWYQLFQDGTQFTDANGIIPKKDGKKLAGNKDFLKSPKHVGSDFVPTPFQVIGVSAFPNGQIVEQTWKYVSEATPNLFVVRVVQTRCAISVTSGLVAALCFTTQARTNTGVAI